MKRLVQSPSSIFFGEEFSITSAKSWPNVSRVYSLDRPDIILMDGDVPILVVEKQWRFLVITLDNVLLELPLLRDRRAFASILVPMWRESTEGD